MKLFDATLDLAGFAQGTEDHVVSEVSGNQIICNDLSGRTANFEDGTIWVRTGADAGKFGRIKSNSAQTLVTDESYDLEPGDEITIGSWQEFNTQKLINAVNSVLRMYKIMKMDCSLEYDPKQKYYDLPAGVTEDIRMVKLPVRYAWAENHYIVSHYWEIENGQLHLYDKYSWHYLEEGKIQLHYADYHGAVRKDEEISGQVDPLYLRYMSWLYLCRNLIQATHKDNLISADMYNEAKIYERDYSHLPNKKLMMKTMTFPKWM